MNNRVHRIRTRAGNAGSAASPGLALAERIQQGPPADLLKHPGQLLRLQRTAGNAAITRLLATTSTSSTAQRVAVAGEKKADGFLANQVAGSRFSEALDVIKSLGNENFDTLDALGERVRSLLPADGVFLGGRPVSIVGLGGRYKEHIPLATSIDYIRRFRNEITEGDSQSLKVGQGRTQGYAVYGQILYNFSGDTISIFHAHDAGKMG